MNWFRNLKTAAKLLLTCGVLAVLMAFVAFQGVRGMSAINEDLAKTGEHAEGLAALMDANLDLVRISRAVRNAILDDDRTAVEKRMADIRKYDESFRTSFDRFRATIAIEANKKKAEQILAQFEELRPEQDQVVALALDQKDAEAKSHLNEIRAKADTIDAEVDELKESKLKLMVDSRTEASATYAASRITVLIVAVVGLALASLIALFVSRLIGAPLRQAAVVLTNVAAGDFTQKLDVHTRDEVGQMAGALNSALDEIRRALTDVRSSAESVSSASQQLSAASENIATGSQEQASSLEETAASLEEMTSTVKQNADNAQQASQLAGGARDVAESGGRTVTKAVVAMGEINEASTRIADIITTIDEIAFQTNLLALNAAVEAARAGEQGRGFAVVAAEVRNLAQRSASAAKEIKGLIQDSVRKVENGTQLVNESGRTLQEIVSSVKRVTDIIAEIAAASREQSTGIDQVNQAVSQMDQVTQGNAAQTEELSGTAQGLASQAQQLQALVARFKLDGGHRVSAAPVASKSHAPKRPAPSRVLTLNRARKPAATVGAPTTTYAATGTDGVPPAEHGFEEY